MWAILVMLVLIMSPLEAVKHTVDALKKSQGYKAEIRRIILERMDFEEMGKRALGRHWRGRTAAERKEYTELFAKLMDVFYRKQVFESVEFINSVDIKYLRERRDGEFAEVDIKVIARNDETAITFKLRLVGDPPADGWKAYDMVIENISTVNNWRSQFDRIIEKEGFSGLLARLRKKIKELDQ